MNNSQNNQPYFKSNPNTIKLKYFYCKMLGHHIKDCHKCIAAKKRAKFPNDKPVRRLLVTRAYFNYRQCDDNWYIDIAPHMT